MRLSSALIGVLGLSACARVPGLDSLGLSRLAPASGIFSRIVKPVVSDEGELGEKTARVNASYYFLLGQQFAAQGRNEEATIAFERVLQLDPDSAYAHYALAQQYIKASRLKEGVALVRRSLELDPKSREAKLLLANLHTMAKKGAEAQAIYLALLAEKPDDEEVFLYVVLGEIENKQYASARKRMEGYLKRNPESAVAWFYLGRLEQEVGNNPAAIASYRKAIDNRGGFVQAGTHLAYLYEQMGKAKEALETYTWLAEQTDGAAFHQKLGQLYLENKEFEKALRAFENLERVEPADLNNKLKVALLLVETRRLQGAADKFQSVVESMPDKENDQVRFYLGAVLEELGDYQKSSFHYAKIPDGSKFYVEALRRRLGALEKSKRGEEALKVLRGVFSSVQAPSENLFEVGVNFLASTKRSDEAWKLLGEGLTKHADSETLIYLKGSLLEKEGRHREAVDVMLGLIKRNPKHVGALNFIGYLWADSNERLAEAEDFVRRALKLRPNDPYIQDSLGWVLYRRGRYLEAEKVLRGALREAPDEAVISDHLGDVLVKLGRPDEAKAFYEKALSIGLDREHEQKRLEATVRSLKAGRINTSCLDPGPLKPACGEAAFHASEPRSPASN